ncbi:MAG: hypothetical protein LQ338_005765 [Usnochroma carphineum]|nr:MAG: hypothetical protein LQ338_005765 [Usnochroma carphineum]
MNALVVKHDERGDVKKIVAKKVSKPQQPEGFDVLVQIRAASVNPIDIKVRAGIYDDYPDYFDRCPRPYQIMGFDGAGIITAVGPSVDSFKAGDEVYFANSPVRQGSNAEYQAVDSRSIALKPPSLSFVEAASMPLTYITAYEALIERLEIQNGEKAALLIINGAGGVGSFASQIARKMLELPVVITTASRPETQSFSQEMGATHVVNHREDLVKQIAELNLDVPLKYIFITYNTDMYIETCAKICAPFGKVCSIVQGQAKMYGTEFMAKSLSFVWALLGTKPYYGIMPQSHGHILKELAEKVERAEIKCTLKQTFPLTLAGLRKAHEFVESGGSVGKNALGVPENGDAFM